MAYAQKNYHKVNSFGSQDWDLLGSDTEEASTPAAQERLSVASLSSDESDTVIIFEGGRLSKASSATPVVGRPLGLYEPVSAINEINDPSSWEADHERLLADLSKDPVLQRVAMNSGQPVEQRLFHQISELEEKLESAENQAKILLLQNQKLVCDNDLLRKRLENTIRMYSTKHLMTVSELEKAKAASELKRAGILLVAGMGLIIIMKKKIVLSGVGLFGALVVAGSLGVYNFLTGEKTDELIKADK